MCAVEHPLNNGKVFGGKHKLHEESMDKTVLQLSLASGAKTFCIIPYEKQFIKL